MALRSGYYGLKKSAINALMSLASTTAGMKIIKSFGDGLNLTNAGKLNLTAATENKLGGVKVGDGLSIEDGVLSADSTGLSVELIYDGNGDPAALETNVSLINEKEFDDYDIIVSIIGQPDDGGISSGHTEKQFISFRSMWDSGVKQSFEGYGQRNLAVSFDTTNNTFNYTSSAGSEGDGYKMRIYKMYGVKL